jgi:succinoglycan biosynthesis transport protein ExoP
MKDLVPSGPEGQYVVAGMESPPAPASPVKIQRLLVFLLKYWWIPLITLILSLSAGGAYVYFKQPTFVSRASMWETVKLRLPEGSMFSEDVQNFVGTQAELLQSGTLRDQALARLRASSNNLVAVGKDGEPLPVAIRVNGGAKSSVFVLQATSPNPAYTSAYLDALMDAYLEYKKNVRKVVSGDTLASISEQVQRTERDLKVEQDALLAFQRTNNLAILQQEGTVAGGYLATLKTKLSDLELENRLLQATVTDQEKTAAGTNNAGADWGDANSGSGSSSGAPSERQSAFKEVQMLKIQRDKLSQYLLPKHPKMVKIEADIERGEKLMDVYRRQNREQLTGSRQANQLRIENVQTAIKEWESKVVEANSRIAEAERLKLNVQRVQSVYDRLVLLVQNVGISRNIDQETLSILEPASPARRSYSEEKSALMMAVFGGLGLGFGIIALIGMRDDRFLSLLEVNEKLGEVVVGQVPEMGQLKGESPLALVEHNDDRYSYAESYRSLRSALLFLAVEGERPKVLLITSAVPSEGKSTVAANLARTLALGGSRVLLVDGDLRQGHLHRLLGMQSEPGLAEALLQPADAGKLRQSNSLPNFSFIARGGALANPGDLFLGPSLDQLLAQWRREFDYVLIDSSPVFVADDASSLAPKADGTLFVVRSRVSRARETREALELLRARQARILGVVLNGVDSTSHSYSYYKYPQYYGGKSGNAEKLKS